MDVPFTRAAPGPRDAAHAAPQDARAADPRGDRTPALGLRRLLLAVAAALLPALPVSTAFAAPAADPADAQPSAAAQGPGQRIYGRTKPLLLQVRTLLRTQDSQSSVGSGFLVQAESAVAPAAGAATGPLLVTNWHVISQYALQPTRHRLVYVTVDGHQGQLELLQFDVINDLALLRPLDAPPAGWPRDALRLRPAEDALPRGARIFALGNPLDVGFAVAEGTHNGLVERSFQPTLFFGGSLSGGMSGGPAVDEQGQLIGVNVAARRDGEQVSFLVPAAQVRALLQRGRAREAAPVPAWPEVARQLHDHQQALTDRFLAMPWRDAGHARWRIPVPQEQFMRCWGRNAAQPVRGLQFERSDCVMDQRVFVSGGLQTGHLGVRHEAYDGSRLGTLRFAQRYSESFDNEFKGFDDRHRSAAQCIERTVQGGRPASTGPGDRPPPERAEAGPPLRAVVCLRGLKRLPGLFDLSVLVATLGQPSEGVQGRLDARGVSAANAQRLAQHYLEGFAWTAQKTASR